LGGGEVTPCLWCREAVERPALLQHSPEHLEYVKRFAAVVYPRFGALGSEVDAAAVAAHLCGACWERIVGLGETVAQ
jgi:hypothetical protein